MDKDFYVSPFIEMVGRYTVRVRDEPARLRISINEDQDEGLLLHTSIDLARRPLTDRTVARMLAPAPVRHPEDDRSHPLARPAPLATRRPFPSARSGSTMTTRTAAGRTPAIMDTILANAAWRVGRAAAARMRIGCLTVVLPDGSREVFGDRSSAERGEIHIHDNAALVRMLVGGETGGGEAYMDGLWSSPDLAALLRVAALNREALALSAGWWRVPAQLRRTFAHRLRRNTRRQSRRNIAAHYDLGNDFYRLFLDETMTYSSAVFASPDQSLADAQRNKYRLIAEGAGLTRGQHVLEIGTGWGGFALYAAGELGCRVTSITISREQHDLARERVRAAGLQDLVDVQLRDYREIERHLRRDRLDRDARGGRRRVLRDVLPDLRRRAEPRAAG